MLTWCVIIRNAYEIFDINSSNCALEIYVLLFLFVFLITPITVSKQTNNGRFVMHDYGVFAAHKCIHHNFMLFVLVINMKTIIHFAQFEMCFCHFRYAEFRLIRLDVGVCCSRLWLCGAITFQPICECMECCPQTKDTEPKALSHTILKINLFIHKLLATNTETMETWTTRNCLSTFH